MNNTKSCYKYEPEILTDYCVVDIETTGLSYLKNEIIEISALKVRANRIVDEFSFLIKPENYINRYISKLTGISNAMLKNAPSILEVLPQFLDFVQNDTILGHNVKFDIGFLNANCVKHLNKTFENKSIDTWKMSKRICDIPNHKLETLAQFYNINSHGHHRALRDCEITFEVYNKMIANF